MPEPRLDAPANGRKPSRIALIATETGETANSPPAESGRDESVAKRFGKGSAFVGIAGRSGPPKGNANGLRHGLKAGKLPADAKYIETRLNIVRRNLEQAVLDAKEEISLPDAAAIQTCIRWERHAALAQRWLTKEYKELKPEQRLTFSREIARASGERDKALAALQLGAKVNRPWIVSGDGDLEDK